MSKEHLIKNISRSTGLAENASEKKLARIVFQTIRDTSKILAQIRPSFFFFSWSLSEEGELVSANPVGTCRRNVFECDKRLAIRLAQGGTAIYDVKYDLPLLIDEKRIDRND